MKKEIKFLLLMLYSFLNICIYAQPSSKIHILFTGSINGKIEGCGCKKDAGAGYARIAHVIKKYRKKFPGTIVLDTGDNTDAKKDLLTLSYTFKFLKRLNYNALISGDQEFYSELTGYFKAINEVSALPILNTGLSFASDSATNKFQNITKSIVSIKRRNIRIAILGYAGKRAYKYLPLDLRESMKFETLDALNLRLENAQKTHNYVILLSHSGIRTDKAIARLQNAPNLIISGHDQLELKKPIRIKKTYIVTSGANGFYIGNVIIKNPGKRIKFRLIPIPFNRTPQDYEIKQLIQEFVKKRDLF